MSESKIIEIIKSDPKRMKILEAVRSLNLPDWIIGAGFVRNPIWDYLHGYEKETPATDIDVAYFDPENQSEEIEKEYEARLNSIIPAEWSVTNQARMAGYNNHTEDYTSTEDALSHWPETATAIGVTLLPNDELKLIAPYGLEDLVDLKVRMSPKFGDQREAFLKRVEKKKWLEKWPKLDLINE